MWMTHFLSVSVLTSLSFRGWLRRPFHINLYAFSYFQKKMFCIHFSRHCFKSHDSYWYSRHFPSTMREKKVFRLILGDPRPSSSLLPHCSVESVSHEILTNLTRKRVTHGVICISSINGNLIVRITALCINASDLSRSDVANVGRLRRQDWILIYFFAPYVWTTRWLTVWHANR